MEHDACFYGANDDGSVAVFPHVITALGHYLSNEAGLPPFTPMAYLVAPPIEATVALDAAMKAADVRVAKVFTPPTETNFAAAWLSGELTDVEAAAMAYLEACVAVCERPF